MWVALCAIEVDSKGRVIEPTKSDLFSFIIVKTGANIVESCRTEKYIFIWI